MKKKVAGIFLSLALIAACSSSTSTSTPSSPTTVYITNTGSKYDLAVCQYLDSSKTAISLRDVCAKGYTPCSVCNPPNCK
jgi:nitrous oxide reductase accessory protein NosL